MPIQTSTEFWENFKAELRAMGLDTSNITEEEPAAATGSSGTRRYGVVMMPRRPQPKREAPQGGTDE